MFQQSGQCLATEIPYFNQDDLEKDGVFLLNVWEQVFFWMKKHANEARRKPPPSQWKNTSRPTPVAKALRPPS